MDVQLTLATIDDLRRYKGELLKIIDDSLKLNYENDESGKLKNNEVYEKLIHYFEVNQTKVWLAKSEQKVVGYAQFFKKNKERIHLNEIAVAEDYQNKGIGSILINAVEKSAKESGAKFVELFCNNVNSIAKCFYEKHDYFPEKFLMKKEI